MSQPLENVPANGHDTLQREIAGLIVKALNLETSAEEIDPKAPLYKEGLGLDSIDALEIVVMLESEFGIKVRNESASRDYFRSVATLAQLVESQAVPV